MKNIFTILLISLNIYSFGQEETVEYKHRYFGIGYRLSTFSVSEIDMNYPVNRLMINVDPIKYARVDFQYGMYKYINHTNITLPTGDRQEEFQYKSNVILVGVLGQYWFDDMLLYGGVRFGRTAEIDEDYYIDYPAPSFDPVVKYYTSTSKYKMITPVLGGEYRFGNRFSVGAEISMLMTTYEYTSTHPNYTSSSLPDDKSIMFETAAFFRFYPF